MSNEATRHAADTAWEQAAVCGACGSRRCRFICAINRRRYAVCLDCNIERLYDRLAETELDSFYENCYSEGDLSATLLEQQLANPTFAFRRQRLEQALEQRARRIFEIGCGDGNFLVTLRRAGWDVQGQEISGATSAIVESRHGIRMFTGPLESVPAECVFPVVAAYQVFEHVYHPAGWLGQVRQLLEPNGLLHLQVPNAASLTRRLTGQAWSGIVFPQHVYFYEPRTLGRLLNRSGFSVLTTVTWDPWHGPGAVAASLASTANRVMTGLRRRSDPVVEHSPTSDPSGPPPATAGRLRTFLHRGLDGISTPLARIEAAVGRGAVVDIIARRD